MTVTAERAIDIRPQQGMQELALSSPADIVISGGAAGAGKTWQLLMEPVRHRGVRHFEAAIFRRTSPEVRNPGGLWTESMKLYPLLGAWPRLSHLDWVFSPAGATVKFAHLQYENTVFDWQGAQICCLGFDQLEQFTEFQFFYMLSRNRSTCGVRPYVRATCNPVPDEDLTGGWLRRFIAWWIDPATGFPLAERAGVVRWFVRIDDELVWADSEEELLEAHPDDNPMSVTFVPGSIYENTELMEKDPGYLAKLKALPLTQRERLLGGNWNVRPGAGRVFNRAWFEIVKAAPRGEGVRVVRYWDKSGTEEAKANPKGAHTSGCRMCELDGVFYVEDVVRGQWSAGQREKVIRQTAEADTRRVKVWAEQEPGSGGKESAENTVRNLHGFVIHVDKVTGDKFVRAEPFSAQAEAGNVKLVRGEWNEPFLRELHNADPHANRQQLDQMDSAAGAFNKLSRAGFGLEIA
jgi:predicted phage terminase large subunit-like protein